MKLAYDLHGADDAPVLVLSGGLGTTTAMWDEQLPVFAERHRVLRVDHPGHGRSPVPAARIDIDDIARALVDLLDELGIASAAFCGLSLGGMVGQWLGANAPERVERLVLACTGARLGTREAYDERAELVRREGIGPVLDGARERWFTPARRDSPAARRILDDLRRMPAEGYAACCEAVGAFDFHADLHRVVPPTLVLFGEEDPVTSPAAIEELATGIPHARSVGIADAAHLANVEQPEQFAAAVLSHLQEGAQV
jgi:3-oxoadipate enol-lactonase